MSDRAGAKPEIDSMDPNRAMLAAVDKDLRNNPVTLLVGQLVYGRSRPATEFQGTVTMLSIAAGIAFGVIYGAFSLGAAIGSIVTVTIVLIGLAALLQARASKHDLEPDRFVALPHAELGDSVPEESERKRAATTIRETWHNEAADSSDTMSAHGAPGPAAGPHSPTNRAN